MANKIKTVYVVHHSHTDIGYTDLQERILLGQEDYIHTALQLLRKPENQKFRWNCETWFCVRDFLKNADEQLRAEFFERMRNEQIGFSANYLNFTDLADGHALNAVMDEMTTMLDAQDIPHETAMFADINGISMGHRNLLLDHGVKFLYTNIHCHHGMYPLYQNQNAYFWEDACGRRLLVWNGEHYNLGNALGICPDEEYIKELIRQGQNPDRIELLNDKLKEYVDDCEKHDYNYDFLVISVSGVYFDNAPPNDEILRIIEQYNSIYSCQSGITLEMVSLQELYRNISKKLENAPVYRGDLTDWWAHGIGSTPYPVKHYRDAQYRYHLCQRLDEKAFETYPELTKTAQDNLLLYAEHTWGHSSTVSNPYDTMVLNLDMRKNSYASKAHEAVSLMLTKISAQKGDILRYYNSTGTLRVCSVNKLSCVQPVQFYIECDSLPNIEVIKTDGTVMDCQISKHPRGALISFADFFESGVDNTYTFREIPESNEPVTKRRAFMGTDQVRDIVNTYDAVSYRLPYEFENDWFRITYRSGKGITSFINKKTGKNMLRQGETPFFTPIYESTSICRDGSENFSEACMRERRILGRNIRGKHAKLYEGVLECVECVERGTVFSTLKFEFALPGTLHCCVYLKLYEATPRIDFNLEIAKTLTFDIENVFLPIGLIVDSKQEAYIQKGGQSAFRPGIDQIPGTCMEYYVTDNGIAYIGSDHSVLVACHDAPLIYMGEMQHHPIQLCDGKEEYNQRPVYSWVMNNIWETNFKIDLSGCITFRYSLYLSDETEPCQAMQQLTESTFDPYSLIVG